MNDYAEFALFYLYLREFYLFRISNLFIYEIQGVT